MTKTFEIACAGYSIMADWYEGKNSDQVMLVLQGFTSSRARQEFFTNYTVDTTGMSALVIDYSGHGDSPFELKDTCPAQHVLEVVCAFDWIKAHYPTAKVTVVGNSYGSFLATHLSHYRSFENLVLRAPAIYRPNTLYDLWSARFTDEGAYRDSIQQYRTDPVALNDNPLFSGKGSRFAGRVLVVVHENDNTIPRQTSDAYIRAFDADSFIAEGFAHAISQSNLCDERLTDYHKQISDWIQPV